MPPLFLNPVYTLRSTAPPLTMAFIVINSQPQSYCLFCLIVVFIHYLALHSLSSSSATRLLMKLCCTLFSVYYTLRHGAAMLIAY